jgi:hypothetical protein
MSLLAFSRRGLVALVLLAIALPGSGQKLSLPQKKPPTPAARPAPPAPTPPQRRDAPTAERPASPTPTPLKPTELPPAALAQVRAVISELQIDSLDKLGSIRFERASNNQRTQIDSGVHLLKPEAGSNFASLPAPLGWKASSTGMRGRSASDAPLGSTSSAALLSGSLDARVVRYQKPQMVDTAVILAREVVFDGDALVLGPNVTQFIIVAETIRSTNGSTIEWFGAGTTADALDPETQAPQGETYLPHDGTGGTFNRRNGGNGPPGKPGHTGNRGVTAPDVSLFVKRFTIEPNNTGSGPAQQVSLPRFDLRGQAGGRGQQGQRGGDGGHGAKGSKAVNGNFGDCKTGPGYGGHGGVGGNGGDGGQGGIGGNGGHIAVHYVEFPADTELLSTAWLFGGGAAGTGGAAGLGGSGGEGGDAGNHSGNCDARPDRRGDDGAPGKVGQIGPAGSAGAAGSADFQPISLAEWEAAFTKPYLVQGHNAHVGEQVTFETLNVSGLAHLHAIDDLDGDQLSFELEQVSENRYTWLLPEILQSSTYTVTIQRDHDTRVTTNSYRIEALPRIDEVRFTDEYEARPGGRARVIGLGLRGDVDVIYDGIRIHPDTFQDQVDVSGAAEPPSIRDWIEFTIPLVATHGERFSRDTGKTAHTVHLDQPFPLSDSDEAKLTLKRSDGMAFLPSVHGFNFENHDMFEAAREFVTQGDDSFGGTVKAFFGDDGFGGHGYQLFREAYGDGEVEGLGGLVSPAVWASFGLWYTYWSSPDEVGTGTCFGLSTLSLHDFFGGVSSQDGKSIPELVRGIAVLHERQVSDEILRLQIAEMLLDGAGPTVNGPNMTEVAVRYISGFLQKADDGDGVHHAPVMQFMPSFGACGEVLVQSANLIGETVNAWDGISPQEAWNDLDAQYHTMTQAFKRSHAVTPYRVVYADPSDDLPSRIYLYDSNDPNKDDVYLEVFRDGARVKFRYEDRYASDPDAASGAPGGFMLGVVPVGMPLGNVDLLFDEDLLAPNLGLSATTAIHETVVTMLGAAKFLGP